jgi:hypothetical protein
MTAIAMIVTLVACSSSSGGADPPPQPPAPAAPVARTIPITITRSRAEGAALLARITVNGSAPFDVLVDTGSSGLRVMKDALQGTAVETTSEAASIDFGGGAKLDGHVARATVALGNVSAAVAFHLVESSAAGLLGAGVQGILGIGLRRGDPASVYSPLAQLDSKTFTIKTGGFDAKVGSITLDTELPANAIALVKAGALPNGKPEWTDDGIEVCFTIAGAPTNPPCASTVFDSGSNYDVVYAPKLPAEQVKDGMLAPGITFEALRKDVFDLKLTIGASPAASVDGIMIDGTDPFTILGVATFFRYDVSFDIDGGRIGLAPL